MNVEDMKPAEEQEFEKTDLSEYEGQKISIAGTEFIEVSSEFNDRGKQWCIRVFSDTVTEIEIQDGKLKVVASELFNLKEDENGLASGEWSPSGNLQKLLDKLKVSHPKDLVGKKATMRLRTTDPDYLGFIYK